MRYGLVACVLFCGGLSLRGGVPLGVTIVADRDNTMYSDPFDPNIPIKSNGTGVYIFAGNTSGNFSRRALMHFNVAGSTIPPGSTITSVQLRLRCSRTVAGATDVSLHKVLADWGEGTSNASANEGQGADATANDATWLHRFYPSDLWTTPGGDFVAAPSGTRSVAGVAVYLWGSTPGMVADVQDWLDNPGTNFGWILIGNESTDTTAKRFQSRENVDTTSRPQLIITYEEPPPPGCPNDPGETACDTDINDDCVIENVELSAIIDAWAAVAPDPRYDLRVDYNDDGQIENFDLGALLDDWANDCN